MDGGACLDYKLTNEPKGSGELNIVSLKVVTKKMNILPANPCI